MSLLTMDRLTDQLGTPDTVIPQLLSYPVEANTIIYAGGLVALNAAGNAVPCTSNAAYRCVGRCEKDAPNRTTDPSGGAAGAISVEVRMGAFFFDSGSGVDAITVAKLQLCYASDDHTANATDSGGTRPAIGAVFQVGTGSLAGQVGVLVGFPSLYVANPEIVSTTPYVARAVATSIGAYTGTTTGVITESVNGALAAQDGVTIAVGDVLFLPHGLSNVQAADVGPWVVTALGGAGKWSMTRPDWWVHGAAIPLKAEVALGPEGTAWAGSAWKSTVVGTIDTTDPLFYPVRLMGAGAVGTQVTGLYARSTAQVSAMDITANHSVLPALVAGNGNGTLAFTGTGTDAISWVVFNF